MFAHMGATVVVDVEDGCVEVVVIVVDVDVNAAVIEVEVVVDVKEVDGPVMVVASGGGTAVHVNNVPSTNKLLMLEKGIP
jgi:hypothetical protein